MVRHEITQGHIDWFKLRMGRVTASELGNLVTPEFKLRDGETPKTYAFEKAAEEWQQAPLIHAGSWATEQGQIMEDEAVPWLALEKGWDIEEGGFIETDDGQMGCSPDGLVMGAEPFGVEVKCPQPTTHVRYLYDGCLPKAYVAQVMGSLYVTGFSKWVFCSYARKFPALVLEIYPDHKAFAAIEEALKSFRTQFNEAKKRIEAAAQLQEAA